MKKVILLSLLGLLLAYIPASAQQLTRAQGEFIVQPTEKGNLKQALRDLAYADGIPTKLSIKKTLVHSQDIYLLSFDYTAINDRVFLQQVAKHPDIFLAQYNHLIDLRLEPNDPQYPAQWQYDNMGQDGGTVGADIDMDLAWDITTGGLTPNGDTIVVAALDDGIDLSHPDFADNRWRNWAEIPDNGIDDDGNGYVDDFEGWNSNADNDNISGGGHGTPVAGIMGAKGNNEIGVAGVSWNVKVMVIKNDFNTSEAGVLAAYGYALDQRVRYNETNGEEGAFVVSTNASWGVDGGDPDDAPVWCNFYDTVGEAGIVSCGATINGNQNVDTFGDLPTACPSDYLISVTNMNRNDVKVTQAGYGLTTIDLGAFGAQTWTTAVGGYGPFGGTSGATPHVAGTVGLLYSAPCSNLATLAMSDPGAAALAVKGYILDGTDPNASLEGITVTGGRLNVRNAIDLLLEDCGPCPPPSGLEAVNVTVDAADLVWTPTENATSDTLEYRLLGAEEWISVGEAASPYSLTGLMTCTEYEFRVKSSCPEEDSGYSSPRTFRTDGCCEAPTEITVTQEGDGYVVSWTPVTAALSYNLFYGFSDEVDGITINDITELSFTIDDIAECAEYQFAVGVTCAEGEESAFSDPVFVITEGCGACTENEYCDRPQGSTVDEWLDSVITNGTANTSGSDDGEAGFFGNPALLDAAETVTVEMTPGYAGTIYPEYFTIWIDLNQDGTFDDDEMMFQSENAIENETETAEFNIPQTAMNGVTRMRIRMLYNQPADEPCDPAGGFFYGETEDYCVEIINAGLEPCPPVGGILLFDITETSFTLNWEGGEEGQVYTVSLDGVFIAETSELTYDFTGLEVCTEYNIGIIAACTEGNDSEEILFMAETLCPPCPEVNDLTVAADIPFTLNVDWTAEEGAESFNVKYAEATGGPETEVNVTAPPYVIEDLGNCLEYIVSVQAVCETGEVSQFLDVTEHTICVDAVEELPKDAETLHLFPNPFTNKLQLEISLTAATDIFRTEVLNTAGQVISVQTLNGLNAGDHLLNVDVRGEAAGVYFVRIHTDGGSTVRRVVRTR